MRSMPTDSCTIARDRQAGHGSRIGILMLETSFMRIAGDMGNAATWPFPVVYRVVPGATAASGVLDGARGLLPGFVAAGKQLVADGALGVATTCGFLSIFQQELAGELGVPVATSSLLQVPWVQAMLAPGRRVGVVTASAAALTAAHLRAAGRGLLARHPEVAAIVLECTNLPPYAAALQAATGLPVYDSYSMIAWFHAGLRPRTFQERR